MEPTPQYQKLGIRTFWVFVFQNSLPGFFIFIIWFILLVVKVMHVEQAAPFLQGVVNFDAAENLLTIALLAGLALIIVCEFFAFGLAALDYYTYFFVLDENALRIKRGLLNKFETSIPYRQIQDVDLEQTLIQQLMGVARVAILTAGHDDNDDKNRTDNSEATLPVIDKNRAEEIREELLKRANIEKVVNVTPNSSVSVGQTQ